MIQLARGMILRALRSIPRSSKFHKGWVAQSEVFFPLTGYRDIIHHIVQPGLTQNRLGLRSCHLRRRRLRVADVKLPCDNTLRFLRNIAHNKVLSPEPATRRSSILVLPQTQRIAGGKVSGFERRFKRKSFTRQNSPDSKVLGFKVSTFIISGDMTKPGSLHFGFVLLCVKGNQFGTKTARIRHEAGKISSSVNVFHLRP